MTRETLRREENSPQKKKLMDIDSEMDSILEKNPVERGVFAPNLDESQQVNVMAFIELKNQNFM